MAMILDAFVSKFAEVLVSLAKDEAVMVLGIHGEINRLQRRLVRIQDFLADAERKQLQNQSIRGWVGELRDVMYDADDIIDECRIESEKRLGSSSSTPRRVCRSLLLFSCIGQCMFRHEIGSKIKGLNLRLDEIYKDRLDLNLIPVHRNSRPENIVSRRTTPLVEPDITGLQIQEDTESLVDLLIREPKQKITIFAIVGMGGIGKTTLAQNILNDKKIKDNFKQIRPIWVCVSQDYSEVDLLRAIIIRAGADPGPRREKEDLEPMLSEVVSTRKLFLVLDDVWDARVWIDLLRKPLQSSDVGSRILVTTRNEAVARGMGADYYHRVGKLSDKDGWILFCKKLSLDENERDMQSLEDIGKRLVKKCDGLPLAIRTVAAVLLTKDRTPSEWEKVLQDPAWSLIQMPEGVMGALFLSFENLPPYLKQCFLYFALFPEDIVHDQEGISCFWIAEGFVEEKSNSEMEELAKEYWRELVSRNLLQLQAEKRDSLGCTIHDLLWSLAQHLARDECFHGDIEGFSRITTSAVSSVIKPRRAFIHDPQTRIVPDVVKKCISLRTLLLAHIENVPDDVFRKLRCLRTLYLRSINTLPDSIGNLIHLRYLNLSESKIEGLPDSIGDLRNLQFLILSKCESLQSLPLSVTKLCNLRNLDLDGTWLPGLPAGIGKLQQLRLLRGFVEYVTGYEHLNRRLYPQVEWCNFEELRSLSQLMTLQICMLDSISPIWTMPSFLPNLKTLCLADFCCEQIPPARLLPQLEVLVISGADHRTTSIGPEFLGVGGNFAAARGDVSASFPKLQELCFEDMQYWEEWWWLNEEEESQTRGLRLFPCLRKLRIRDCPMLRSLPEGLLRHATALDELWIEGTQRLREIKNFPTVTKLTIVNTSNLVYVLNLPAVEDVECYGNDFSEAHIIAPNKDHLVAYISREDLDDK